MSARARRPADPLEQAIEAALDPGGFVSGRGCYSFVSDLEEVETELAALVPTAPARAAALYEAFLAGCYEKAEEVDDSGAQFSMFVTDLFCGSVTARQAAGAAPDETAARLLAWMDDDPYSLTYRFEDDVAKVLDRAGRAALTSQVRARFEAAAQPAVAADASRPANESYARRRWAEVLRTLYAAQRDLDSYVALTQETGVTPADCYALAKMQSARRKPEEALSWVERGIALDATTPHGSPDRHRLAELKTRLLVKLGREEAAVDAAWADHRARPSRYSYDDLMKLVPEAERRDWHDRAVDAAMGGDLHTIIGLLVHTEETERLVELIGRSADEELEAVSHHTTEEAAEKIERAHPGAAARLWRAQGMRIVKAKKSRYYNGALRNFERARRCYDEAGLTADWEQVVDEVRAKHHRKTSFMPGFEEIVRGAEQEPEPSFLEAAKARWSVPDEQVRQRR